MQAKLDEHLQFLRSNRGKKRGDFFRNIRKSMIDSLKLYIEVAHIRQMLFLDISLYKIVRAKNKESSYDLLIDLPLEADLPRRRDNFKKALYSFVKNQPESNSPVPIPQCKFLFETDAEAEDNCLLNRDSLEKVETGKVEKDKANKLDPLDILTLGNNVKETLY